MSHWKLILAYDGTPFHGWQIQPGQPTAQGLLSDAIFRTVGERVLPQGSGRTDAGVHALAQVASFTLAAPIPSANLHNALNRCLPPSIRVLAAEAVPPGFHARHSALKKTYEYRIFPLKTQPATICPPILAPYVWPCRWPLDLTLLNQAAAHVLGEHDFTSFAASDPDLTTRSTPKMNSKNIERDIKLPNYTNEINEFKRPATSEHNLIRTISETHWHTDDDLLIYRVTANGFLHHMVRNLVGTFVQCGAGRLTSSAIPAILAARNRSAAGPTAPAAGLFLISVEYPAEHPPTEHPQPATRNSL